MKLRVWVEHCLSETDRRTGVKYPRYVIRAYDVKASDDPDKAYGEAIEKVRRFLLPTDRIYSVQRVPEGRV